MHRDSKIGHLSSIFFNSALGENIKKPQGCFYKKLLQNYCKIIAKFIKTCPNITKLILVQFTLNFEGQIKYTVLRSNILLHFCVTPYKTMEAILHFEENYAKICFILLDPDVAFQRLRLTKSW